MCIRDRVGAGHPDGGAFEPGAGGEGDTADGYRIGGGGAGSYTQLTPPAGGVGAISVGAGVL